MRKGLFVLAIVPLAPIAPAQTRGDFQLTKNQSAPDQHAAIHLHGCAKYQSNQHDRCLEVEVEFTAVLDSTDELTFKYFILVNGRLLTGEVTHINISAGRENRSVVYVSPRTLARFTGNR